VHYFSNCRNRFQEPGRGGKSHIRYSKPILKTAVNSERATSA
jgi:hypothetical protein